MKNKLGLILVIVLVIIFVGRFIKLTDNAIQPEKEDNNEISSLTYDDIKDIPESDIIVSNFTSDNKNNDEFETLVVSADAVVKGKVEDISYEVIQGRAWTKMKFRVLEDFVSDIKKDTLIDIYYIGGYIRLTTHLQYFDDATQFDRDIIKNKDKKILKEVYDDETVYVRSYDNLVICLSYNTQKEIMSDNFYERASSSGVLKLIGNEYKQLYGDEENRYSINLEEVDNIKSIVNKN